MWIKQYKYPFTENPVILTLEGIKFVQIGIECPHSIPIFPYEQFSSEMINNLTDNSLENSQDFDIKITIQDTNSTDTNLNYYYKINSSDILEFNGLNKKSLTIEILEITDPYTIITIAYEKED